jgi:serine phosphatase RsbU (regulator of sigma subunit)
MQVTVAPIRSADGEVIGCVQTFKDVSTLLSDLEGARRIQSLSLEHDMPDDPRIRFSTSYTPHDMVGGDYFAIRRLNEDQYGFLLADVMGHGVSAALHTMLLSSLWTRHNASLTNPIEFADTMNRELRRVVKDESFASAICGVIDAKARILRLVSAGGPPIIVFHDSGEVQELESTGVPFGIMEDSSYEELTARIENRDCLLMFSDGAFEVHNAQQEMLGVEGLIQILKKHGYPETGFQKKFFKSIGEELLKYSNTIRLNDDMTFIEVRFSA